SALPVEQVAVGGLAIEQPGDLVDEPLEHRLELELARDDLGRTQERRLLQQAPPIFFEQARRVNGERQLARDRLDESDLALRPRARAARSRRQDARVREPRRARRPTVCARGPGPYRPPATASASLPRPRRRAWPRSAPRRERR